MGLLLALLLAVSVKEDNTALRSGCSADAPLVAALPAGTPLRLRFALSGESVPCYKIAAEMGGRQIEGYLPAAAIAGLDSFDKGRRDASWVTTNEALTAVRNAPAFDALKAPAGVGLPLPSSLKVVLAQSEQLINGNQPGKALELLEPEMKKRRDPSLLAMAGVAAWRADDTRQALEYWQQSLELAPNPDLETLIQRVEKSVPVTKAVTNSTACG